LTKLVLLLNIFNTLLAILDEDAVAGDQSGETEDDKELVTYYISTNVQFTSSKMSRYIKFILVYVNHIHSLI
jgi:hypothetical protein